MTKQELENRSLEELEQLFKEKKAELAQLNSQIPTPLTEYKDHPNLKFDETGKPCCYFEPKRWKTIEKEEVNGKEHEYEVVHESFADGQFVRCPHHAKLAAELPAKYQEFSAKYAKLREKSIALLKEEAKKLDSGELEELIEEQDKSGALINVNQRALDMLPASSVFKLREYYEQSEYVAEQATKLLDEVPY